MSRNITVILTMQILLLASTSLASPTLGSMTVYNDKLEWEAATKDIEEFRTSAHAIARANEITSTPNGNADLGSVLTFESANTGLSRSFILISTNIPRTMARGLVLDDSEAGLAGPRNISIGDADGIGDPNTRSLYENDDWRLGVYSGPKLTSFAFTIVGNDESLAESMQFYNGNILIGSIVDLATPDGTRFIGVTTREAITRIVFDEDEIDPGPDFDDIAIRDFCFGTMREKPTAVTSASWASIKALFR